MGDLKQREQATKGQGEGTTAAVLHRERLPALYAGRARGGLTDRRPMFER